MPVFNAEATLLEAVRSVQAQTYAHWEFLIFNDGSTDASLALATAAARQDNRIRVMDSEHVGIVGALNGACREAEGPVLARMDADDLMHPERLARQLALLEAEPDMAICGTGVRMFGEKVGSGRRRYEVWVNSLVSHEEMQRELFVECPLPHPTFMMRRDMLEALGFYRECGWPEDYDLCMRACQAGMRLGKAPERLLDWRESEGRLSMVDPRYSGAAFRALKRHYLWAMYLSKRRRFHQWGAGDVGKRWLREWGIRRPEAVVDIDPRKFGQRIHGVTVIEADELPAADETFIVVAVGTPGAREDIRGTLCPRGYMEGVDFVFVA